MPRSVMVVACACVATSEKGIGGGSVGDGAVDGCDDAGAVAVVGRDDGRLPGSVVGRDCA